MPTELDLRELMCPAALASIGPLELLSERVVDGFLSGAHRSTHKGGCFEFAEHRAYAPGDETRLIDWRVFARSDRYYIKQFEEETNLQVLMVLDGSGSMQFAASTISKYDYARLACACLSRLMLRQRDAVGLISTANDGRTYVPPRSTAWHLRAIAEMLVRARPGGDASLAGVLHTVGKRLKRRGLIIVFSDCFDDSERLVKALRLLRLRGHDVLVFHVLRPRNRLSRSTSGRGLSVSKRRGCISISIRRRSAKTTLNGLGGSSRIQPRMPPRPLRACAPVDGSAFGRSTCTLFETPHAGRRSRSRPAIDSTACAC